MSDLFKKRMSGEISGDFAVFLIGMRFNRPWKIHKWLPLVSAGTEMKKITNIGSSGNQYQLNTPHAPAWARFNRAVGSNGDVGIWHETFLVRDGAYECVYNNMPRFGLAKAGEHMPATGKRETATGRMGLTDGDDAPVDVTGNYRGS